MHSESDPGAPPKCRERPRAPSHARDSCGRLDIRPSGILALRTRPARIRRGRQRHVRQTDRGRPPGCRKRQLAQFHTGEDSGVLSTGPRGPPGCCERRRAMSQAGDSRGALGPMPGTAVSRSVSGPWNTACLLRATSRNVPRRGRQRRALYPARLARGPREATQVQRAMPTPRIGQSSSALGPGSATRFPRATPPRAVSRWG